MSLEKAIAENTAEVKSLREVLTKLLDSQGAVVTGTVELVSDDTENKVETEVIVDSNRTGTEEEQLAEDKQTEQDHAKEIANDAVANDDIPAAEDRPFYTKPSRRSSQECKLEKAEKSGNPDEIAAAKLALAEFLVTKGKRDLKILNNMESGDAKHATDKADAIRYAEHDLVQWESNLANLKNLTAEPAATETTEDTNAEEEVETKTTPTPPAKTEAPAAPTPTPPAPKVDTRGAPEGFVFTAAALPVELQYSDYVTAGWTNDTLVSEGLMEVAPDKPEVVIDINHLREQMVQLTQSKGGAALTATIGKYAPSLEEIDEGDFDAFLDDLQLLPNIEQ